MLAFCNQQGLAPLTNRGYTPMRMDCSISREVDAYVAMARARELATKLGFDQIDRTRIEIAVLELTRNIIVHASKGHMVLQSIEQEGRVGFVVEAIDQGPGIADIELAMRDGYSTANTLGAGLPGVKRLMDTFAIESAPGVGTRVRAVKWLTQPAHKRAGGSR
jgi:serine/threonine-protein kinase RsbT